MTMVMTMTTTMMMVIKKKNNNDNNGCDQHGNTALHEAAWKGFSKTVTILCKAKVFIIIIIVIIIITIIIINIIIADKPANSQYKY